MRPRRMIFIAAMVLAMFATVIAATATSQETSEAAGEPRKPLDDIPGYGISREGILRDETIAYWEAWRRDRMVQRCMRTAGFDWTPEALYPEEEIVAIADHLDITPWASRAGTEWPEARNMRMVEGLGRRDKDRFNQAMYGETTENVEYMREHGGRVPPGRDAVTFGTRGCRGKADRAIPGVWELKRTLAEPILEARSAARETREFKTGQRAYGQCMAGQGMPNVDHPEDVDEALAAGNVEAATVAAEKCDHLWHAAAAKAEVRVAEVLRENHARLIDRHTRRYAGVLEQIRKDDEFRRYVAVSAARAEAMTDR